MAISGKKILIVEDELDNLELLRTILRKYDPILLSAKTGEKAIETFKENNDISLILLDIKLPGIFGLEVLKKVKEINPNVVVIAQTAFAMHGDREKAIQAGCDEYIAKPFVASELLDKINMFEY